MPTMELVKNPSVEKINKMAQIAVANRDNGHVEIALKGFREIISLHPENAPAHFECAKLYKEKGSDRQALKHIQQAITYDAARLQYVIFLSTLLHGLGRGQESLEAMQKFVKKAPDNALALCVLGYYLNFFGFSKDAESACRKSLSIDHDLVEAHHNLAVILYNQNRFQESIKAFKEALVLDHGNDEYNTYLGMIHLLLGEFQRGWYYYQKRTLCEGMVKHTLPGDVWLGESLQGKTLFVYTEQGLGDTIQFARYLPLLSEQYETRIVFEVQPELYPLFAAFPGVDTIIARGDSLPQYDFHCPLLSIAAIRETDLSSIPQLIPQLTIDRGMVAFWKTEMETLGGGMRIGFVWAGSPLHENDHNRSCTPEFFKGLWALPETHWFSLQKGAASQSLNSHIVNQSNVFNMDPLITSFMDTAAIIMNLDLVITVDTAVAHLAATLGKTVYLLLPFTPDWRWLLDRPDSPWYPGMILFRQGRKQGWEEVFTALKEELIRKAREKNIPDLGSMN